MKSRHDSLVDKVESELRVRGYDKIYKNVEYSNVRCGEIDLYARGEGFVLLFEAKCNKTRKSYVKAVDQLSRAKKYYFRGDRVFGFLVYDVENPVFEWIK